MAEIELSEANFDAEVLASAIPVLVDFWAPWCGPCKMLAPVVAELAAAYTGRLKVCTVNTDQNMAVTGRYQIQSIPSVLLFKGGVVIQRIVGFKQKQEFIRIIDAAM